MERDAVVHVAGGSTLIGAALVRRLGAAGWDSLAGAGGAEPDATDAAAVDAFFARWKPAYVFVAAGRSGGIGANQRYPADLMRDNLLGACHLIDAAHRHGARRLLYLASSCSYPRLCPQPMHPGSLMTGPLEPTNVAYATAKIAGIELCAAYRRQHGDDFVAAIPANAFGPGDDFGPEDSHVIGALLARMHAAKAAGAPEVVVWGSGAPRREFVYADDLADACILAMERYRGPGPINLGSGIDLSIRALAEEVRAVVEYPGALRFDASRPDGMPAKVLDCRIIRELGFAPRTDMRAALQATYDWYREVSR